MNRGNRKSPNTKKGRYTRLALRSIGIIIFVFLIIVKVNFSEVLILFYKIKIKYFLFSCFLFILMFIFKSMRWRLLQPLLPMTLMSLA